MSAKRLRPSHVAAIVRDVCTSCDAPCAAFRAGLLDHTDADTSCPRKWPRRWGCYGRCTGGGQDMRRAEIGPASAIATAFFSATKAKRALAAFWRWVIAGFPIADALRRRQLASICAACDAWRPTGNLGLGECTDPRCGCTKAKRWLATETCPRGLWPKWTGRTLWRALSAELRRALNPAARWPAASLHGP